MPRSLAFGTFWLFAVACGGGETPSSTGTGGVAGAAGSTAGSAGSSMGGAAPGGAGGGAGSGAMAGSTPAAGAGSGGAAAGAAGSGAAGESGAGAGGAGAGGAGAGGAAGTAGNAGGTPVEDTLPALPSAWQEHAVVAFQGEIYVLGGFATSATARVIAYDPVGQAWRAVSDFPEAFNHANAAAIGDRLYVASYYIGGSMSAASDNVYAYNPDLEEWEPRAAMPAGTGRASACVATLGDKIYLFGGSRGGTVNEVSAYDTVLDQWQPLMPLPEPREHCVAGAVNGIIYIVGGRSMGISNLEPRSLAYDPVANGYTEVAAIRTARGGVAGSVLRNKLFVFGGEGNSAVQSGVFPDIEAYDPATNLWEALPPMELPRHGFGAATLADRIYLPGGATRQGAGAVTDHSVFYYE